MNIIKPLFLLINVTFSLIAMESWPPLKDPIADGDNNINKKIEKLLENPNIKLLHDKEYINLYTELDRDYTIKTSEISLSDLLFDYDKKEFPVGKIFLKDNENYQCINDNYDYIKEKQIKNSETNIKIELICKKEIKGKGKQERFFSIKSLNPILPQQSPRPSLIAHPYLFGGLLVGVGLLAGFVLGATYNRAYATLPG